MVYVVSVRGIYNTNIEVEIDASNPEEALSKAMFNLKKNKLSKYLPKNPRNYSKVIVKNYLKKF